MKLTYTGAGTIDIPNAGILGWATGESHDVPEVIGHELMARGDFTLELSGTEPTTKELQPEE